MSTDDRMSRLAFEWGGLALTIQWWIYLGFVHQLRRYVDKVAKDFNLGNLPDRVSQLRPPALKVPCSYVYLVVFVSIAVGAIGVLFVRGLREAMAREQ